MSWTRNQLKTNARHTIRKNTINIIIVCFVIAIVASGYSSIQLGMETEGLEFRTPPTISTEIYDVVKDIQTQIQQEKEDLQNALKNGVVTEYLQKGEDVVSAIKQRLVLEVTTIKIITPIFLLLFWIFVQNLLLVGKCRFFLETKNYPKTNVKRLLFVYRVRKIFNVAKIMFLRTLFIFLWSFTIVGGFVKYYSYRMIPYILAENPAISSKDAFALSAEMMRGNKWDAFKLDLSFFFWRLLSLATLRIAGFFYVNPLLSATNSELYFALREEALEKRLPLSQYLNDPYLTTFPPEEIPRERYPLDLYPLPLIHPREWSSLNYQRDYSPLSLVYIFFIMAFVGWGWEVFLFFLKVGSFVNRGTLRGPWLPIYGFGSVLMLLLLKPLIERPGAFFAGAMVVCGVLEYFASWMLETLFHQSWWDYSNAFLNINGRICLKGLLFFAIGGSLIAYVFAPIIDDIIQLIPQKRRKALAGVLILLFSVDVIVGYSSPNQGDGITTPARISTSAFVLPPENDVPTFPEPSFPQ